MHRSCAFIAEHSTEDLKFRVNGILKGKPALMIYDRHPELRNKFEREFWAPGYYVSSNGNVDEETILKYFREQEEELYQEHRILE